MAPKATQVLPAVRGSPVVLVLVVIDIVVASPRRASSPGRADGTPTPRGRTGRGASARVAQAARTYCANDFRTLFTLGTATALQ